jgi:hypothetical protein
MQTGTNFKIHFEPIGFQVVDCTHLDFGKPQWRAVAKKVKNVRSPYVADVFILEYY